MRYLLSILMIFAAFSAPALCADNLSNFQKPLKTVAGPDGAGYDTTQDNPETIVAKIISVFLSILGIIFLILTIYGGYLWMTARQDSGQADKAKEVIKNGVIGMIIIAAAYAISFFIMTKIIDIGSSDGQQPLQARIQTG